jgi:hypothetical protein
VVDLFSNVCMFISLFVLEPDIVAGDGVYSRYITNYPTTGKYKYKVCIHLQSSTVQCSPVQYSTVQYSTVQYSAVKYSTVHYRTVYIN